MRITQKYLERKVERLNAKLGWAAGNGDIIELDHAACYGGYCLVYKNGSHHVTPRMSGKELDQYLRGALDWIICEKSYEEGEIL